jgi:hypothetical protein
LDTIISEITSFVQAFVEALIDEIFKALEELYDSVIDSISEATGADVEMLMALAPIAGQFLQDAFQMLPDSLVGDSLAKITDFQKYLDIVGNLGNFNGMLRTLAMTNVMGQVNEIMSYVDLNTWIPDSVKGVLSTRFTGFKSRSFVTDDGKPHYKNIFNTKILKAEAAIIEEAAKDRAVGNIEKNIDELEKISVNTDPRCQGCVVDSSSEFIVY